jgi:hypothetical protein
MTTRALDRRHRAPATWWNDRWAWRGALAAGPAGALAAILHALAVERAPLEQALVAYLVGAMVAAGLGCLLLGPLGGSVATYRHRRGARYPDLAGDVYPDEPAPPEDVYPVEQAPFHDRTPVRELPEPAPPHASEVTDGGDRVRSGT